MPLSKKMFAPNRARASKEGVPVDVNEVVGWAVVLASESFALLDLEVLLVAVLEELALAPSVSKFSPTSTVILFKRQQSLVEMNRKT
jgi:hypothetical protein